MTLNDSQPGPSQASGSSISTANGNATITPAGTPTGPLVFTSTPEGARVNKHVYNLEFKIKLLLLINHRFVRQVLPMSA